MRYWGKNIEIDGAFYKTAAGRKVLPTPAEIVQLKATGNFFQHEGDVETFEVTTQNMMRDIESNQVGGVIVDAINRTNKTLKIIPLTGKEQMAVAAGGLGRKPCSIAVGKSFQTAGNDSVIWFEPWSRMGSLFGGGNSPYQLLVHELQHALRQIRGKWYRTGAVYAFPNAEELFSVTVENMYLSAAGQSHRMLGAYRMDVPLGDRSAADFYLQYGNEIDVWCRELPDLASRLEFLTGFWNPIQVRRAALDAAKRR